MLDLLLATVGVVLLVAVGLALLSALTLVPFVLSLQMAEHRRFSTPRWGALALLGSLAGLAVMAWVLLRTDRSAVYVLVGVPVVFAAPLALWISEESQSALGGRAGRHE